MRGDSEPSRQNGRGRSGVLTRSLGYLVGGVHIHAFGRETYFRVLVRPSITDNSRCSPVVRQP